MVKVEECYRNGTLAEALEEAAKFIRKIGEANVRHVIATYESRDGLWWVDVVYDVYEEEK